MKTVVEYWIENKGMFNVLLIWEIRDDKTTVHQQEILLGQTLTYAEALNLISNFQLSGLGAMERLLENPGPFEGPPKGYVLSRIGGVESIEPKNALLAYPGLEAKFSKKLQETEDSGAEE